MILRRVIAHIKAQHWTAIIIEFVIVVIGIFVGLQVNNWNEARRDRARERDYLQGIAAELEESIVSIGRSIELDQERIGLDEFLIKASADPAVVRAEPGRFIYAMTRGGWTFTPTISGNTFEEIKSSGNLGIFRDRQLVLDLMKFYATVQYEAQWGNFRAFIQSEYTRRSAAILSAQELMLAPSNTHDVPNVAAEDVVAAYQRMLKKPEFIEWVPTVMFFRTDDLRSDNQRRDQARELRDRIVALTGADLPASAAKARLP